MGRQPFVTRLVLGRSAFQVPDESFSGDQTLDRQTSFSSIQRPAAYAQQYDQQGHPQNLISQALSRQSRRAQNDVLTAVGVCVRVDKNGKPLASHGENDPDLRPAVKTILKENDYGLFLATSDWVLFCLAELCLLGLRQRLQTFRFYSGVPFLTVVKTEWKYFGAPKFIFAGTVASVLFRHLDSAGPQAFRDIYNRLTRRFVWRVTEPRRKQYIRRVMDIIENILKTATFATIAPIEIFATLQRLDLVPAWPLLPHLWGAFSLTIFGPMLSSRATSKAKFLNRVAALLSSPMVILWILLYAKQQVDEKLYLYIKLALPKPSGPDLDSIEAAVLEDLNNSHILGLGRGNAKQQIMEDLKKVYTNIHTVGTTLMRWVPQSFMRWTHSTPEDAKERISREQASGLGRRNSTLRELGYGTIVEGVNSTIRPTPLQQDALEEFPGFSSGLPGPVEVADPSQDQPYVFMANSNNSSQASVAVDEGGDYVSSTKSLRTANQRHHVTTLTAHMADTFAMHFSTHIADLLFLPLEALFVRSVALRFLSATPSTALSGQAAGWRTQVFPPRNWLGWGVGPGGLRVYITNMAFCGVFELVVGVGIWQISSGAAWLMGRRWFGWGRF